MSPSSVGLGKGSRLYDRGVVVGVEVVSDEIGGAREARYVPEVDEYDGRYDDGVIELYFVEVEVLDAEAPSEPY